MPTQTFLNLPKEKQNKILESAKLEFSNHLYEDASINRIIKNIDMCRGTFYLCPTAFRGEPHGGADGEEHNLDPRLTAEYRHKS